MPFFGCLERIYKRNGIRETPFHSTPLYSLQIDRGVDGWGEWMEQLMKLSFLPFILRFNVFDMRAPWEQWTCNSFNSIPFCCNYEWEVGTFFLSISKHLNYSIMGAFFHSTNKHPNSCNHLVLFLSLQVEVLSTRMLLKMEVMWGENIVYCILCEILLSLLGSYDIHVPLFSNPRWDLNLTTLDIWMTSYSSCLSS